MELNLNADVSWHQESYPQFEVRQIAGQEGWFTPAADWVALRFEFRQDGNLELGFVVQGELHEGVFALEFEFDTDVATVSFDC